MAGKGEALIKAEYLVHIQTQDLLPEVTKVKPEEAEDQPAVKKIKISDNHDAADAKEDKEGEEEEEGRDGDKNDRKRKKEHRGQNKNKNRPRPMKYANEEKLCRFYLDGKPETECPKLPNCHFLHNIDEYLASKKDKIDSSECYVFKYYGKCARGLTCLYASSHMDSNKQNVVNLELWAKMKETYEALHRPLLDTSTQVKLRKHQINFKEVEKIYSTRNPSLAVESRVKPSGAGAVTDEDVISLKPAEVKKIDWQDKLYLSPLTTVGNLPFRRLCVEMGADITCSEMSLATSILHGNMHEFALHRRHPSEKLWGIQLCANNGALAAKAATALADCGVDYDFVDLNMGCPIEHIYRQGAGSGLMCRTNKFQSFVKGMTSVLAARSKPFTVKMRTGVKTDKNNAHDLIKFCKENGVSAVTLHGRSKEQRYLRHADWNYIGECAKVASPMALFGNGDILSWEEFMEKKALSNVTGAMIGRGALIKPWIFQEIKEQRHIDLNSSDRLELIRKYSNYGLDHWGSDSQGVATTRRFLLEWLSFFHRYIPYGILEEPPQHINDRPPRYFGRDEMETLLGSPNAADWVKISEMFLGPVPDNFVFLPKHKANSYSNG